MAILFCSGKWANSLNCSSLPRSHSNHCNDYQEVLEDARFCYKPVINPYKSSETYYPYLEPLTDVSGIQAQQLCCYTHWVWSLQDSSRESTDAGTSPDSQPAYSEDNGKYVSSLWLSNDQFSPISLPASPVVSHYGYEFHKHTKIRERNLNSDLFCWALSFYFILMGHFRNSLNFHHLKMKNRWKVVMNMLNNKGLVWLHRTVIS